MFPTSDSGTDRRASALAITALSVSILSVLALSAVSYFLSSLQNDTDSTARVRAFYVAEAGRADAFAHVVKNPAEVTYSSGTRVLPDDAGAASGEYSYTITDITLPDQDPLRVVRVRAFWPSESHPMAEYPVQFWMEESGGTWQMVTYMKDDS